MVVSFIDQNALSLHRSILVHASLSRLQLLHPNGLDNLLVLDVIFVLLETSQNGIRKICLGLYTCTCNQRTFVKYRCLCVNGELDETSPGY